MVVSRAFDAKRQHSRQAPRLPMASVRRHTTQRADPGFLERHCMHALQSQPLSRVTPQAWQSRHGPASCGAYWWHLEQSPAEK